MITQSKINDFEKFVLAGWAIFTVQNNDTKNKFTYRVKKNNQNYDSTTRWFVSVLSNSDNYRNYTYIGMIKNNKFYYTKGSQVGKDSKSFIVFDWLWEHYKELPENIAIWHEGTCGRCGKKLTVPESINSGFGPECINFV